MRDGRVKPGHDALLRFVVRGLDPRICRFSCTPLLIPAKAGIKLHSAISQSWTPTLGADGRVKPGHDAFYVVMRGLDPRICNRARLPDVKMAPS